MIIEKVVVILCALVTAVALFIVLVSHIASNTDSIVNCARACNGRMRGYSEKTLEGRTGLAPVCVCESPEASL